MPGHDKIAQPDGHQLPYIYRTQKDFMSAATDILANFNHTSGDQYIVVMENHVSRTSLTELRREHRQEHRQEFCRELRRERHRECHRECRLENVYETIVWGAIAICFMVVIYALLVVLRLFPILLFDLFL